MAPRHPDDHLDELIAAKRLIVTTGEIQVLIAIAATTTMVTVDTSTNPTKVKPANIADLTFARVGMDDSLVSSFKANLKLLLDFIAADIDNLPDNANMNIGKVLEFIRLSILAAG